MQNRFTFVSVVLVSVLLSSLSVSAEETSAKPDAQASVADASGVQEVDKPLQVNGQSRNLSMMMVLKTDKDKINFVDIRKDYHDEIPSTLY